MKHLLVSLLAIWVFSSAVFAADFTGTVVKVADGDTLTVSHGTQETKVRLNGIDCPEKDQPFGPEATAHTSTRVKGQQVRIKDHGRDKYGRTVGDVILSDGTILNRELVQAGVCWWYRKYSSDPSLGQLEREARAARKGLWAKADARPPWEFRHAGTEVVPGSGLGRRAPPTALESGEQSLEEPVLGNRRSQIYHRPDCPSYHLISPKNRVPFSSPGEAEQAGYRLARNCP